MNEVENTTPPEPELSPDAPTEAEPEFDFPLPPASFEFLIVSLRAQCEMQLGLMHFGPEEQRPKPNLNIARHSIDLLAVLEEKTKGNLTFEEKRLLENSLTELRFRFVQVASKESAPK